MLQLIAQGVFTGTVAADKFDQDSISEPTQLSVLASNDSAETVVIQSQKRIESDDSTIDIFIIKVVASDTIRHHGIELSLKNDDHTESLYLDAAQASQLRNEFAGLIMWYDRFGACDAGRCVQGVARCRPSQPKRQAFCPGFYSSPIGDRGTIVSTPRYSFNFPSIPPSVFVNEMDAAIAEIIQYSSPENRSTSD